MENIIKNGGIKILHIYSDAMDLYGDCFNIICIKKALEERFGISCAVDEVGIGDEINPRDYDMVYIGHGKARNLNAVSEHFIKYSKEINSAVENNKLFFVTGNALLLFGREFKTSLGEVKKGTGLFDYSGFDSGNVFTSDVVGKLLIDGTESDFYTYGFINRTHHFSDDFKNKYPLFKVIKGAGNTRNNSEKLEGVHYKSFFGTWQMGPLLARNPDIAEVILKRLLGENYIEPVGKNKKSLEKEALELTLGEFNLDIENKNK